MAVWLVLLITVVIGLGVGAFVFWYRQRRTAVHTQVEDALKHLFDGAFHHRPVTPASVAGALGTTQDAAAALLADMDRTGLVMPVADGWVLTDAGRAAAARVVRAHRLWERHLADRTGYDAREWHRQSERREHAMTPADVDALAASLEYPRFDPHGDPIPTADGKMPASRPPLTLAQLPPGAHARVIHVEDEPAAYFGELLAGGIYVGMPIENVTQRAGRVLVRSGGHTVEVSTAAAGNVSVVRQVMPATQTPADAVGLSALRPGEVGRVVEISPRCMGAARRRFLDLGILPGTLIRAEMVSPSGDPTAYRIRGALIGLRREQADMIAVTRVAGVDRADAVKLGAVV